MPKLMSIDDFKKLCEDSRREIGVRLTTGTRTSVDSEPCGIAAGARDLMICEGTGCAASQSHDIRTALAAEIKGRGLDGAVRIVQTGCRGFCAMGPIVMIYPEGIFYCQVQPEDVPLLVEETLLKGRIVERLAYQEPLSHKAYPLL